MSVSKSVLLIGLILALPALVVAQDPGVDRQEVKDPNPAVGNPGIIEATGGPDGFGYTYFDSNSGCPVSFQDISATGTALPLALGNNDNGAANLALPFSFDFYGTLYTMLRASTNGYLGDQFDNGGDNDNDCPIPAGPVAARIYAYHDDLVAPAGTSGMFAQDFSPCPLTSPTFPGATLDCTILQWNNMIYFSGGGGPFDMQAILYDQSWEIVYQYGSDVGQHGSGSTQGIMNQNSTIALQHSCNTANSIPNNFSICFTHPNGTPVELESFDAKAVSE